jgi:hypothetical protein
MSMDQALLSALERVLKDSAESGKNLEKQQRELREILRITAGEREQSRQEIALMRRENWELAQQVGALQRQVIDCAQRVENLTGLLVRLSEGSRN